MQKSHALAVGTLVFAISLAGCSKTVKNDGFFFPITESPSPIPSGPAPSPSPSPSVTPSPSPTPSHDPEECAEDPFGELQQFSNYSKDGVLMTDVLAESRIAGKNLELYTVTAGKAESPDAERADVVAQNSLIYKSGNVPSGRITYGNSINAKRIAVLGGFKRMQSLDFPSWNAHLDRLSTVYAGTTGPGDVEFRCESNPGKPELQPHGGGKPPLCSLNLSGEHRGRNVFHVDPLELSRVEHVNIVIPPGATALVNVGGERIALRNTRFHLAPGVTANTIVWNFPENKQLALSRLNLPGTILAPHSNFSASEVEIQGGVMSHCTSACTVRWKKTQFTGCLPIVEAP